MLPTDCSYAVRDEKARRTEACRAVRIMLWQNKAKSLRKKSPAAPRGSSNPVLAEAGGSPSPRSRGLKLQGRVLPPRLILFEPLVTSVKAGAAGGVKIASQMLSVAPLSA